MREDEIPRPHYLYGNLLMTSRHCSTTLPVTPRETQGTIVACEKKCLKVGNWSEIGSYHARDRVQCRGSRAYTHELRFTDLMREVW
jgi:hypothetical protein